MVDALVYHTCTRSLAHTCASLPPAPHACDDARAPRAPPSEALSSVVSLRLYGAALWFCAGVAPLFLFSGLGRYPRGSGARTVVARPPSGSTRGAPRAGEWDSAMAPRQRPRVPVGRPRRSLRAPTRFSRRALKVPLALPVGPGEVPLGIPLGACRLPVGPPTGSLQAPSGTSHSRLQRPAGRPRRQSWGAQPRATRPTAGRLLSDRGVRHARRREGASGPARPLTHGTRRSPTRLSWQGCRPTKHRRKCERGNA
jgi:hypothetical protein